MAKNMPTPKGQPAQQQRVGGPTNMARPKNVAKRKTAVTKPPVSNIDFDAIAKTPNPEKRRDAIREAVSQSPYVSLSDLFQNISRAGRAILEHLEKRIDKEAKQGLGVRTWRLMMVVNPDGSKPKPGQLVRWVRQRHNHLDFGHGKKIGATEAEEMRRRGDGYMLTEEAEVELDDCCCFDVTYQDASDLLSKHGIYYLTFDPDGNRADDTPVSRMKRVSKAGTCNWRFVEIPPGYEHLAPSQKKTRKRKTSDAVDPLKDIKQTLDPSSGKLQEKEIGGKDVG